MGDRKTMRRFRAIAALVLLALSGCATVEYVPTASRQPTHPVGFEDVMVTYVKPAKGYVVVGRIETKHCGAIDQATLLLRRRAAELGVDGVEEVFCARNGLVNAGNCAGNAFLWSTP